ncbi:hypothetical protein H7F28_23305 [Brevibacterium sp. PAMC23299]|nr:hypothetical protein H7F28_23305 [Brevibacterium sp. PAMC23299]
MTEKQMLSALDRHGLRPLTLGKIDDSIIAASETCALNAVDAKFWREVEPDELAEYETQTERFAGKGKVSLCSFEFVYLSGPDSVIE